MTLLALALAAFVAGELSAVVAAHGTRTDDTTGYRWTTDQPIFLSGNAGTQSIQYWDCHVVPDDGPARWIDQRRMKPLIGMRSVIWRRAGVLVTPWFAGPATVDCGSGGTIVTGAAAYPCAVTLGTWFPAVYAALTVAGLAAVPRRRKAVPSVG